MIADLDKILKKRLVEYLEATLPSQRQKEIKECSLEAIVELLFNRKFYDCLESLRQEYLNCSVRWMDSNAEENFVVAASK